MKIRNHIHTLNICLHTKMTIKHSIYIGSVTVATDQCTVYMQSEEIWNRKQKIRIDMNGAMKRYYFTPVIGSKHSQFLLHKWKKLLALLFREIRVVFRQVKSFLMQEYLNAHFRLNKESLMSSRCLLVIPNAYDHCPILSLIWWWSVIVDGRVHTSCVDRLPRLCVQPGVHDVLIWLAYGHHPNQ